MVVNISQHWNTEVEEKFTLLGYFVSFFPPFLVIVELETYSPSGIVRITGVHLLDCCKNEQQMSFFYVFVIAAVFPVWIFDIAPPCFSPISHYSLRASVRSWGLAALVQEKSLTFEAL